MQSDGAVKKIGDTVLYTLTLPPVGCDDFFNADMADGDHCIEQGGMLLYSQEWLSGARHGKCILYCDGQKVHEVPYYRGVRMGTEYIYNHGKIVYSADWRSDRINGEIMIRNPIDPSEEIVQIFIIESSAPKKIFRTGRQDLVEKMKWDLDSRHMADVVEKMVVFIVKTSHARVQAGRGGSGATTNNNALITRYVIPASRSSCSIDSASDTRSAPGSFLGTRSRSSTASINSVSRVKNSLFKRSPSISSLTKLKLSSDDDSSSIASSASAFDRQRSTTSYEPSRSGDAKIQSFYAAAAFENQRQQDIAIMAPIPKGTLSPPLSPKLRVGDIVIIEDTEQRPAQGRINEDEDDIDRAIREANEQAQRIKESRMKAAQAKLAADVVTRSSVGSGSKTKRMSDKLKGLGKK
jgi:hypothetical protein